MTAAPDDISPAELEAIEKRCEAATPGPWEQEYASNGGGIATAEFYIPGHNQDETVEMIAEDAVFIAAARTDIPRLIAALRARDAWLTHAGEQMADYANRLDAARALLARAAELIRDMLVWGTNIDCTTESRKVLAEIEGAEHGKP
jgi:hypothetical protein